ncbi:MAG: hypothetical protein GXO77_13765 [Calditrichaeota bacterium]|nr:hypothetical protein [Calditrichota bacterium]
MNTNSNSLAIPKAVQKFLLLLIVAGSLTFIAGLFLSPRRIWGNFLITDFYILSLSLGAAFFVAVNYASNSGWVVAIRRIPEAISSTIWLSGIGALILIFGIHSLYEWSHSAAIHEEVSGYFKAWFNESFFIIRLVVYFVVWIVLNRAILANSNRQDKHPDIAYTRKNVRNSALFIIFGGIAFCLASIDLMMSLQARWYSTVFPVLMISGMFLSGLAIIIVFVVILRHIGYSHIFTTEHLHTLGNYLLSFSVFWVYLWVSQHLLIWYSNIPEETSYYIFRHFGGWGSLSFLNVVLNWLIPFAVLLPVAARKSDKIMLQMAIVVLIGHWLDLFILVMPAFLGPEPSVSVWEILPFIGFISLFVLVVFRRLRKSSLLPVNDPYLVESLPDSERIVKSRNF